MESQERSPRIDHVAWGRLPVEGLPAFKDAKLFPGGARAWDWRETGTRHVPGIQPADVKELLDHGAEVVVLAKGMLEQLRVCPETLALLQAKGIPAHVLPTEAAVRLYNELRERHKVAGLFRRAAPARLSSVGTASPDLPGRRPPSCSWRADRSKEPSHAKADPQHR